MNLHKNVIIINILLLSVFVIVLELIFGSWISNEPALYNFIRFRNLNIVHNNADLPGQQKQVVYKRDRYGFRGLDGDPKDVFILTVGGSTTDQRYINDGLTFQDRLQANFLRNARVVDVVNAGIDGQSTFGHLLNFPYWFQKIPGLQPKYVLFYVGINDFYNFSKREVYDKLYEKIGVQLLLYIKDRSAFYSTARIVRSMIWAPQVAHSFDSSPQLMNPDAYTTDRSYKTYLNEAVERSLANLETRIENLALLARQMGAVPIFVTQRSRLWHVKDGRLIGVVGWSPDEFSPALEGFVNMTGVDRYHLERLQAAAILNACGKVEGICIDLAGEIRLDPSIDFYDGFHTTPAGSARIGDYLYEKLKTLP